MPRIFDRVKIDTEIKSFCVRNKISLQQHEFNYLKNAFIGINSLWLNNYRKIKTIKYLMIAEAPLWGHNKKYIYNPNIDNSQFFYRSDLESVLNMDIADKRDFINICNKIGLIIIDISPYPLNSTDTGINYSKTENNSKKLSKRLYQELVIHTLNEYFLKKIDLVSKKKTDKIITFFRYERVKSTFLGIVSKALISKKMITNENEIKDIFQDGGGVHRIKLCQILHNGKCPNENY